jgi:hypothetical protein
MPYPEFDGIPLRAPVYLSLWDVLPHLATGLLFVAVLFLLRNYLFHRHVQRQFEFAMPLVVIAGFFSAFVGVVVRLQDTVDYGFSWGLAFFCITVGIMSFAFFVSVRAANPQIAARQANPQIAARQATQRTLPEDACWSCGRALSADSNRCPDCGWPDAETAESGEPDDALESPS